MDSKKMRSSITSVITSATAFKAAVEKASEVLNEEEMHEIVEVFFKEKRPKVSIDNMLCRYGIPY